MMKQNVSLAFVRKIMMEFADLTGLSSAAKAPRRYLWTDAFAVCNFMELFRQTRDEVFKNLALQLVDQVHQVLSRHREDDPRNGWISGLGEQEGKLHPTKGGLRIGKKLNERGLEDPFDERLEWDRDGQYYHYLTKWMHALNRVGKVTGNTIYNRWAVELAKAAHAGFIYEPSPGALKHIYWKMSIDLTYPLVQSMGHHDPIDGFITYHEVKASSGFNKLPEMDLSKEIADMADICKGKSWATHDPLGIGGLLCDVYRAAQLILFTDFQPIDLPEVLLDASLVGLETFSSMNHLMFPADHRLAFRELGLTIGLKAVKRLEKLIKNNSDLFNNGRAIRKRLKNLKRYKSLIGQIEGFWLEPANRQADSWTEHQDINTVMLATSLAPDGYLML